MDQFSVRFDAATKTVDAYSTFRLPFEPKGVARSLRDELKSLLSTFSAGPTERLIATYVSADPWPCDVENILLYNVGVGAFAGAARYGLSLERQRRAPTRRADEFAASHHCRYQLASRSSSPVPDWPVRFRTNPAARLPTRPEQAWIWAKTASFDSTDSIGAAQTYWMRVDLTGPPAARLNLAAVIKPLVDGLLVGLANHDGTDTALVTERLGVRLPGHENLGRLLESAAIAPFGTMRAIWPRGSGLQWNPPDGACERLELSVTHLSDPHAPWTATVGIAPLVSR